MYLFFGCKVTKFPSKKETFCYSFPFKKEIIYNFFPFQKESLSV